MVTRQIERFLASILAALLLAGCGAGGGSSESSSTSSTTTTTTTTTTAALVVRTATLTGGQEVPAIATSATGKGAVVVVDATTREIRGGFSFTGLSGNATAAHIHKAAAGSGGGVEIGLTLVSDAGVPIAALIPAGTNLTQAQYDSLLAGELYFNVHTTANAGGEIRGQLTGQGGNVAAVATLNGAQEVPAVTTSATGNAVLVVDSTSKSIIIAAETFNGMTPSATHIHQAAAGASGGVIIGLVSGAGPAAGTYVATAPHAAVLSDAQYAALNAGELYFNVHSATYSNGEIRGQLAVQTQAAAGLVPTLASIQSSVFTPTCALSGCHGSSAPQANLVLASGSSFGNLVGVASSSGGFTRVVAGNATDSLLIRKLEETAPPLGVRMPFGGPYLPQSTINVIRQWIQLGAPNS